MAPSFKQCLHRAIIDTSLVNRVARKFWQQRLFDEFQFDRNPDMSLFEAVAQKPSDSCASNIAIIAGKFLYVHADELAGELCVHVAGVCERISDRFVPMSETVVHAFANDLADVT